MRSLLNTYLDQAKTVSPPFVAYRRIHNSKLGTGGCLTITSITVQRLYSIIELSFYSHEFWLGFDGFAYSTLRAQSV